MADEVDVAALTAEQQLALQQYTAVTNQELNEAVPLLQRCQWNVQIAIARFFDGEPAEHPVAVAATQQAPSDTRRAENLMNGLGSPRSSASGRRARIEPAPRVVPQPESQVNTQAPLVLSLLWAPVGLLYSLIARYFRFLGYLFPFVPRAWGRLTASNIRRPPSQRSAGRRPLNPRDTAARFIREFEEEYGPNELPFHEGGYASAFDLAKKDLKFLLVVLVSPEHDLTRPFLRDTLLAPAVVSFLRDPSNNILLWAGSVSDSEAYSVSSALNCTKFPFSGLIVHTPSVSASAMGIACRLAGPISAPQYLSKLRAAMAQHTAALARVRASRAEANAARDIRSQQDSAYERSLATDRERKRKAAEAAAAAEKAEQEAREAADRAERVVRRFEGEVGIEEVYAFVECYDTLHEETSADKSAAGERQQSGSDDATTAPADFTHVYAFHLVSPMPRAVYDVAETKSLKALLGRSANLIVERVGGDDEDEEGEEGGEGAGVGNQA